MTQQSDGSFYAKYSKNRLFISATPYEKSFVSKEYCIARHNDKMCFLPNCSYHIMLIGHIKQLLQKLDAFCFHYQHLHCLYTLFKYRFGGRTVVKSGQLFDIVQKAAQPNHQNRGTHRMPSIAKKRPSRKKNKNKC